MMLKSLSVIALTAILTGCLAHATPADVPTFDKDAHGTACVPAGTWLDPKTLSPLTLNTVLDRLRTKDIVLLGETHMAVNHHRWHMQTVAQLYAQNPDMILGFEAFPRRVQDALDKWVNGDLSEEEFLIASEWETVWKYDAAFYTPLFHFARMNHIPMVALNVDRTLISEVSEKGWEDVPEALKQGISTPAPATPPYLDMLSNVYTKHGDDDEDRQPPTLDDPNFSKFVDVQLTWDRAMAEAAVSALDAAREQGRTPRLVAIVGRGHMDHFFGIPEQLKDLGHKNFAVLTPWDSLRKCSDLRLADGTPTADAIFSLATTPDDVPRAKQKLGIFIEDADDGIKIGDVVEKSIAEKAGLQKDDLIKSAAGVDVRQSGALIKIIKNMQPGTWLPLTVERGGKTIEIIARFPTPDEQHKKVHQ